VFDASARTSISAGEVPAVALPDRGAEDNCLALHALTPLNITKAIVDRHTDDSESDAQARELLIELLRSGAGGLEEQVGVKAPG